MRNLVVAALFVLAMCAPFAALAQDGARGTMLSVSAQGESEARPDYATLNLGVTANAATAPAALAENSQRMESLMRALRAAGIAERDIQTAQVNVSPRYRRSDTEEDRVIAFEATNTVRVLVRRVSEAGRIASAAIEAGGNRIHNVSFLLDEPTAQLDIARRNASEEARRRAEVYAASFGLRVVRVVSITEPGAAVVTVGAEDEIVVTGSRQGAPVRSASISPGVITTRSTINVTFELR